MSKDNKRHLFQVRRKEARAGRRDPYYTPERDMAHVGPQMVAGAVRAVDCLSFPDSPHGEAYLNAGLKEPWLREFIEQNGLTYQAIIDSEAPLKLGKALNLIMTSEHPPAAMDVTGFSKLPAAMQMLFYARIGQVFLAGVWAGVKDVGQLDSAPPVSFEEFLDDVNDAFQKLLGQEEHDDTYCLPRGDGTAGDVGTGSYDDPPTTPSG